MKHVILKQLPENTETLEDALAKLGKCGYWLGVHFSGNEVKGFVVEYGRDDYAIITGATNGNSWGKYTKASLRERLTEALKDSPEGEVKSFTRQQEFAAWLAS